MCGGVSVSLGLESAQNHDEKYKQRVTCSKIERCGSSLLTSNRKTEFGKKLVISKQNRKRKSAVKVVADAVYTAKFENRITYEGKRESD
jgi:hypothetical protein